VDFLLALIKLFR